LQAPPQDVELAKASVPVPEDPDVLPQNEIDRLSSLLNPKNPAAGVTSTSAAAQNFATDRKVVQWQPDWVIYNDDFRPVIFNPFPDPVRIVYIEGGLPKTLTIPPLTSVLPDLGQGVISFTAMIVDSLGQLKDVAVGSFSSRLPPDIYTNVPVVVNYRDVTYKPIVVNQITDVGEDPSVGERKVLLDGATPAWGIWTQTATGERQFVVHKTQQFPGIDAPAEGPLPGNYRLLAANEPLSTANVLLIVAAAVVAALALGTMVVRILRARKSRLHPPSVVPVAAPSARVLNVAVVDDNRNVLAKSVVLACDTPYEVRVDVGPWRGGSMPDNPRPLPTDQQQPTAFGGSWFDVLIVSSDVDVKSKLHRLFLPSSGPSWMCRCNGPQHTCTPKDRQPYLYIPMRTPSLAGPASLRCIVYSHNNVVQSTRVDVMVGRGKADGENVRAAVDFSLAGDVGDGRLLPPRQLSVLTNDSPSGNHTIAVNDGKHPIAVYLTEQEAAKVLAACRSKLAQIVLNQSGTGTNYDRDNRKPTEAFIADLKVLALLGSHLFGAVVPDRYDRAYLREQLTRRSKIQITRVTPTVFPWALIYDIPREVTASWTLCRLLEEWDTAAEQLAEYPDGCPYEAEHPAMNVLCPYGFWGLRHQIEEPPSLKQGLLQRVIRVSGSAKAALARSLALNPELTMQHFSELAGCLSPPFELLSCDSHELIRSAFGDPALPLVYFYCHGAKARLADTDLEIPLLQIGQSDQIAPTDFATWDAADKWPVSHWRDTAPLVFINGCETAKLMPEDIVSFVDALAGMHAAGVIGTEIAVDQTIAGEVALRFYRQFCGVAKASVGMALHRTRIDLLRKGNISGLVYTPYCSMDLALEFIGTPQGSASADTAIPASSRLVTVPSGGTKALR
jgi:hypothetical protein